MSVTELRLARQHLRFGYVKQSKRNEEVAAREYQEAMAGVDRLLQ